MDFIVKPVSREELRETAKIIWKLAKYNPGDRIPFPVVEFLEVIMPGIDDDFTLDLLGNNEMGNNYGLTIPSIHTIQLREEVYTDALKGNGFCRMIIFHEIAHYLLHFNETPKYASMSNNSITPCRSAEWQAKALAGEVLIPYTEKKELSVEEIMELFAVSEEAAKKQKYKAH